jgi:hypothetical protein
MLTVRSHLGQQASKLIGDSSNDLHDSTDTGSLIRCFFRMTNVLMSGRVDLVNNTSASVRSVGRAQYIEFLDHREACIWARATYPVALSPASRLMVFFLHDMFHNEPWSRLIR